MRDAGGPRVLCQSCGKAEAQVRLTEVAKGAKREIMLCSACAQAKGNVLEPPAFQVTSLTLPQSMDQMLAPVLEALKSGIIKVPSKEPDKKCPRCGITLAEFRKRGRLGCPYDYEAFAEELGSLLQKIHGKKEHRGRGPARPKKRQTHRQKVEALRRELDEAIRGEHYETAAGLRDRLKQLERPDKEGDE
jgi:protein arginine kinase activator